MAIFSQRFQANNSNSSSDMPLLFLNYKTKSYVGSTSSVAVSDYPNSYFFSFTFKYFKYLTAPLLCACPFLHPF